MSNPVFLAIHDWFFIPVPVKRQVFAIAVGVALVAGVILGLAIKGAFPYWVFGMAAFVIGWTLGRVKWPF